MCSMKIVVTTHLHPTLAKPVFSPQCRQSNQFKSQRKHLVDGNSNRKQKLSRKVSDHEPDSAVQEIPQGQKFNCPRTPRPYSALPPQAHPEIPQITGTYTGRKRTNTDFRNDQGHLWMKRGREGGDPAIPIKSWEKMLHFLSYCLGGTKKRESICVLHCQSS